jgi:hypothetical protein
MISLLSVFVSALDTRAFFNNQGLNFIVIQPLISICLSTMNKGSLQDWILLFYSA